ncbi:Uncharacterised protein [Trueperella bialowiezensis]|uniref:Uncharacterized protein n=2 Tax=Trueperella bialowiezensis TaxID=312285 RepID=A0A448PBF8_9ACTO|nr:Uncharacterised protein [Trueperella bialowiezensis]
MSLLGFPSSQWCVRMAEPKATPKPGGSHERINVTQVLGELGQHERGEQIANLEKVHQELTIRLGRAQA